MYIILLSIIFGLILGTFIRIDIPPELTRYTAVAIVGILDSIFGAVRASIDNKYNTTIFLSGLAFNMFIAVLITYVGDKLNLDLYLAILVALTIRIFSNIGMIKSTTLEKMARKSSATTANK
ncbi:MAG: small basic family protein [Patescibacteria group bacterium]|jgi:small basic protein